jgi:hypothetical protein
LHIIIGSIKTQTIQEHQAEIAILQAVKTAGSSTHRILPIDKGEDDGKAFIISWHDI